MKQQNTIVPFHKIKVGEFFRFPRAPKRLYQKYDGGCAQVVHGPSIGETAEFCGKQVIPVVVKIIGM
jgi:hypothetical protein